MSVNFDQFNFDNLYDWTGSTDQFFSIRRLILADGPAAGLQMIEVITAGGIRALLCESRALDIYELHFKGVNLGFMSKNGLAGADRSWLTPGEFQKTWPAGFLATCGLRNTGPDTTEGTDYHPLHGRIGQTSAEIISIGIDKENMVLTISGQIQESALFGHNLIVERSISFDLKGSKIKLSDKIYNRSAEAEPVFLLYHINFGFPFLSPKLKVKYPEGKVIPRTEEAEKGLDKHKEITEPVDGCPEQVFFHVPSQVNVDLKKQLPLAEYPKHDTPDNIAKVCLENKEMRVKAVLSWNWSELPVLSQWKSMKSGDYALGIEPGNTLLRGRQEELKIGGSPQLAGRSSMNAGFELVCEQI